MTAECELTKYHIAFPKRSGNYNVKILRSCRHLKDAWTRRSTSTCCERSTAAKRMGKKMRKALNLSLPIIFIALIQFFVVATPIVAQSQTNGPVETYGSFMFVSDFPNALFLLGEVRDGDSFEFRKALRSHKIELVVLASPGGSVSEGLQIAGITHDKSLATYIPINSTCASACSYVFFSGTSRFAAGALGVHQFFSSAPVDQNTESDSKTTSTVQYIASEIIGTLNEFGTPAFVYEKMFSTNDIYFFSDEEKMKLNLDMIEVAGAATLATIDQFLYEMAAAETIQSNQGALTEQPLQEPDKVPENPSQTNTPSIIELIQFELNRLGCLADPPDGEVGRRTKDALRRYSQKVNIEYDEGNLTSLFFWGVLKKQSVRVCVSHSKPTAPNSSELPNVLARYWKVTCINPISSNSGSVFARIENYDNRNGAVYLITTNPQGLDTALNGRVLDGTLAIEGWVGTFNSSYTSINFYDPSCAGGMIWSIMEN